MHVSGTELLVMTLTAWVCPLDIGCPLSTKAYTKLEASTPE
ncbi:hypothetical protein CGRA01v4_09674 [Colletotrichum graminicola]|nr:hypothetical protein CGRA01v4_09674 [Colletotrichum graminicola]